MSPEPDTRWPPLSVAVRTLCDFTARAGDLDLRFTPAPSAQEGVAGHQWVASRRPAHHLHEVSLSGQHGRLMVRGRADGIDPLTHRVEEVKTHRGALDRQPANLRALHWAQAKVYACLWAQQSQVDQVEVALVYLNIDDGEETVWVERHTRSDLQRFFEGLCQRYQAWADSEHEHRRARDDALHRLSFPCEGFRVGQRELAEAAYRAASQGRVLLAQASTGIGKTLGTLFPTLKAMPSQAIDRVFFLSAKTSGRQLALDALQQMPTQGCRVLELVARDKACEHPDKACHGDSCPLARGFYDRLPAARLAAAHTRTLDKATLRTLALQHEICPYYLGQEMARWSDVVIGDYNHFFDLSAMLHALTVAHEWRVSVLIDEAHNLVDRARLMHTASLDQADLQAVRRDAPHGPVKKALDALHKQWSALNRTATAPHHVLAEWPQGWHRALQKAVQAIGEHQADHPTEPDTTLQTFFLAAWPWLTLAERFGDHSVIDLMPRQRGTRTLSQITLRNLIPAPHLTPRLDTAHSVVLFSATLQPWHFHQTLLGLPDRTVCLDVPTPFHPDQLQVTVARHISTRYKDRQGAIPAMVELMRRQWADRPGNYLAFFSSFEFLTQVADALALAAPEVPQWHQSRGMTESAQQAFLARFTPEGQGIGFAVLGGAFAEGVDLPGQRLIGAFIATLGMPQVNAINEMCRERLDALLGQGHEHTYLYPGVQKVVQAAGRVIRTTDDVGVLHLMDDRFTQARVRALMPSWWQWR